MVKKLLAAEGFYELKDEDVIALRGFEAFFAHDLLAYADDEETYLGGTGSLHQWSLAASICSKKNHRREEGQIDDLMDGERHGSSEDFKLSVDIEVLGNDFMHVAAFGHYQ